MQSNRRSKWKSDRTKKTPQQCGVFNMARQEGFEPPTAWFVARYSIQLSYWRVRPRIIGTRDFLSMSFSKIKTNCKNGGEGGIRTLDTVLGYTPLAGERLRPLGHLSRGSSGKSECSRAFPTALNEADSSGHHPLETEGACDLP